MGPRKSRSQRIVTEVHGTLVQIKEHCFPRNPCQLHAFRAKPQLVVSEHLLLLHGHIHHGLLCGSHDVPQHRSAAAP